MNNIVRQELAKRLDELKKLELPLREEMNRLDLLAFEATRPHREARARWCDVFTEMNSIQAIIGQSATVPDLKIIEPADFIEPAV